MTHPRGRDRQRPAARTPPAGPGALQAQVELALPGGQPLPRRGFQQLHSASSCADPRCSMSRDPRREECTICTAVAPDAVFTVRTYGDTSPAYEPGLVRNFSHREQRNRRSATRRVDQGQTVAEVRAKPPRICPATPTAANPRTPSPATGAPAHRLTASQTRTGPQKLWDAGRPERTRQACPRHLRRDACWHEISLRTNRHDSCQRHGKRLAVMKCAYRALRS